MTRRASVALAGALVAACGNGPRPDAVGFAGAPDADVPPAPIPRDAAFDLMPRDLVEPAPDVPLSGERCNGLDDDGDGLVDELSCPEHFVCASTRICECGALRARCVNLCVTPATNPLHCGRCGNACAQTHECVGGVCVEACAAGSARCGAACVSLSDNPEHCGACGRRCGAGVGCERGRCLALEVFPPAGARIGTRRPELRWSAPGAATLCADALCERPIAQLGDDASRSARVAEALAPGVYFWRAQEGRRPYPFRVDARDLTLPGTLPAAPDLNADGLADVVVGCRGSVRVWYGRRAALPDRPDLGLEFAEPADPFLHAAGDFNGDIAGDVVVYQSGLALLGGATGDASATLMTLGLVAGVPAGDLDGDGRTDWLGISPVAAFVGPTRVPIAVAQPPPSPRGAAAVGDVNGDGYDDVAFGAPGASPPRAYLVAGSASASLRAAVFPPAPRTTGFGDVVATAGDVNGDGFADVLVGLGPLGAALYLGGRDGVTYHRTLSGADEELLVRAAGDVDGDGFGDVLAVVRAGGEVRLYRGGREGLAAAPVALRDARWTAVEALGVPGDIDGDGLDDVVAGAPSAGLVYVLHGAATAPLTRVETLRGEALDECGRAVL